MISMKVLKIIAAVGTVTALITIGVSLSHKKNANLRPTPSASQAQWNEDYFVNAGDTANGASSGKASKGPGPSSSGKANKGPGPSPSGKANKGRSPAPSTPQPTRRISLQPTRRNIFVNSPRCVPGSRCFQNGDFGVNDNTRFNIDLVLEVVNESHANAFVNARAKWMEVVTGDLPSQPSSEIPISNGIGYNCINNPSPIIDDLVICGRDVPIDGTGNVLGNAGPLWTRRDPLTGKITPVIGGMQFDIVDIDNMIVRGTWESVILHEMGHVLGIGTLWVSNGLIDSNLMYRGQRAISVWRNDWGCVTAAPPVERDGMPQSRGSHWAENCLNSELMSSNAQETPPMPLSRLTIASLEDIGYTVNYLAADVYDGTNTNSASGCCRPPLSPVGDDLMEDPKPPLSSTGTENAVAYGLNILMQRALPSPIVEVDGLEYVGDRVIVVLYEENGYIYDVQVTNE